MSSKFLSHLQIAAAASLLACIPSPGLAALVDSPVPTNAYITYNGYDWAWASPVAPNAFGTLDLSFQSQFGWRLPTAEELLLAPQATQFIFAGANVPLGGSDPVSGANFQFTDTTLNGPAALAVPYFDTFYAHGDWCDAPGSNCTFVTGLPWNDNSNVFQETLVIRLAAAVPEPGTWAMMLLGFGGIGMAMRGRRKRTELTFSRAA